MTEDSTAQELMAAYGISLEEETAEEYRGLLVVAEGQQGQVSEASLAALGVGRDLADAFGARLEVLLLGAGEDQAPGLISRGADAVLLPQAPAAYQAQAWLAALVSAVQTRRPEVVLLAGTDITRDLAPRAAQCLDTGLIGGAQELRAEADERLVVGIVPLYGGRLLGEFACPVRRPQFIALAEKVGRVPSEDRWRTGEVVHLPA